MPHKWCRLTAAGLALLMLALMLPVAAAGEPPDVETSGAGVDAPHAQTAEAAPDPAGRPMTLTEVLVIAIVEGVTEFLPVSSTGHILLVQRFMDIPQTVAADAFAVVIQAGAILAILGLYFRRSKQMALGLLGRDPAGLRLAVHIALAFLPFAVIALLFYGAVKNHFGLWETVSGWLIGGVVILLVVWWRRGRGPGEGLTMDQLNWRMALGIGLIQCASMWPGTSRALAAILGGLLVGMSLRAAVEFSFLLGLVTLLAAAVYDGCRHGHHIFDEYGLVIPLVGFLVAALAAAAAVKWMVSYLERYTLAIFGYYRIALALAVAALLWFGVIVEDPEAEPILLPPDPPELIDP